MKKYSKLVGITVLTAILLFIFGSFISYLLLELIAAIIGISLPTLRSTEALQFWVLTGMLFASGVLFASCALWAMTLCLVYFSKQFSTFSLARYFIFLIISIISVLVGIGFRFVYVAIIPLGTIGLPLAVMEFLEWGLIVNLLVCSAVTVFLMISRSGQSRMSENEA